VVGFEKNSLLIVKSNVLGPEDKITIGTIKRYSRYYIGIHTFERRKNDDDDDGGH